jgi:hypothetical protein
MISALKTGKPMKLLAALILAVALDAPASAVQPARPSAEALLHQIERQGGRTVLRNLWQDDKAFDAVIEGIESGDPAWLDVAVAEAYETKALAALAGVRDRKLAGLARECARRVRLPRPTGRTGGA